MPLFTSDLIQVSKTSEKYMSLTHGPEGAFTMSFKDFYSILDSLIIKNSKTTLLVLTSRISLTRNLKSLNPKPPP